MKALTELQKATIKKHVEAGVSESIQQGATVGMLRLTLELMAIIQTINPKVMDKARALADE